MSLCHPGVMLACRSSRRADGQEGNEYYHREWPSWSQSGFVLGSLCETLELKSLLTLGIQADNFPSPG